MSRRPVVFLFGDGAKRRDSGIQTKGYQKLKEGALQKQKETDEKYVHETEQALSEMQSDFLKRKKDLEEKAQSEIKMLEKKQRQLVAYLFYQKVENNMFQFECANVSLSCQEIVRDSMYSMTWTWL